jgi:hypothetical protein
MITLSPPSARNLVQYALLSDSALRQLKRPEIPQRFIVVDLLLGSGRCAPVVDLEAYQVAEAMLRRLDAEEVDDLPLVWRSYLADPSSAAEERLLGSGLGSSLMEWAPLVVAFLSTKVLLGAAVDSAKDGIRRRSFAMWRKARRRFRRRRPVLISFDERQLDVIAEHAKTMALAANRTPGEADRFAEALVDALQRPTNG